MRFKIKAQLLQNTQELQELKLNEYRNFVKSFIGEEVNSETIFLNSDQVIKKTTKIPLSKIQKINFVDYMLLLFYIRSISVGDLITLYTTEKTDVQFKINISLNSVIDLIFNNIPTDFFIPYTFQNITIHYQLPTIQEIMYFEQSNDISIPTFFIKEITSSNFTVNLNQLQYIDREKIVKQLPIKLALQIDKHIQDFYKHLNKINLLESIENKNFNKSLPFTTNSQILAFLIKIIYNTDLENIYNGLFILSKATNLDGTFLDNCSPGEFFLFAKKLEEMNQTKTQQGDESNSPDNLPPITSEADFSELE